MRTTDDLTRRASVAGDEPSRRNTGPASTTVNTVLAQDVVFSHGSVSMAKDSPVALFANPFREGAEEFCLLDADGRLTYAHREPDGGGWTQEPLDDLVDGPITGLVAALHWDGSVWLFVAIGATGALHGLYLRSDSTWHLGSVEAPGAWAELSVHYLSDRPATACVIGLDASRRTIHVLQPRFPTSEATAPWFSVLGAELPEALPAVCVAGITGDGVLHVYAYDGKSIVLHTAAGAWLPDRVITDSQDALGLVGVWNSPGGVGCVFIGSDGLLRLFFHREGNDYVKLVSTNEQFYRAIVWQDERELLHLYVKDSSRAGVLQVVHQTGWALDTSDCLEPVFLSVPEDGKDTVLALPVATGVGRFQVDPAPDAYPTQLLVPSGGGAPVRLASQDVTTSWWSEEPVVLSGDPAPGLTLRHVCDVTVRDGFGAPMPFWPVQLTAQSTVDVEIAGRTMRLGPSDTEHVLTDAVGKVSIRVAAAGLTVPTIQLAAKGLPGGANVEAAGGVQAYLAGTGVLAAHPQPVSADLLLNATVGDSWLVPGWHGDDDAPLTLPTPPQVVDALASVFAQARGATAGPGFVVQRSDPRQPAFRALAPGESPRQALAASDDNDLTPYLQDLWRGIRDGALDVVGYATDGAGSFTISCQTPGAVTVHAEYSLVTDADAALAVEAIFQQLGAGVDRLVQWLAWDIPFKDIWETASALSQALENLPAAVTAAIKKYLALLKPGWFVDHQTQAESALATVSAQVRGLRVDGLRGPGPLVAGLPPAAYQPDILMTPCSTWFHDLVAGHGHAPEPIEALGDETAWDRFWQTMTTSDAGRAYQAAFDKAATDLLALWDLDDARAVDGTPLEDLVAVARGLLPTALPLADAVLADALGLMKTTADDLKAALDQPLVVPGLNDVYAWFQRQAGVTAGQEVPLTRGRLGALYAAVPTTGTYLTLLGKAPFADGTFPAFDLPTQDGASITGRELALGIQVFAGVAQLLYTGIDLYLDFAESDQVTNMAIALFEIIGFAAAGYPQFWDTPFDSDAGDVIAWCQWGLWALLYLADGFLSLLSADHCLVRHYNGRAGNAILFMVGAAQVALAGAVFGVSDQNELDQDWLYASIAASLSTLTAPVRMLMPPSGRAAGAALGTKALLDFLADLYAGGRYVSLPFSQLVHPVAITTTSLAAGTVGQQYTATLTAANGCPPYTWAVSGTLPTGIEFDPDKGTLGGRPAAGTAGSYELAFTVTDYYPPPSTATATLTLEVS